MNAEARPSSLRLSHLRSDAATRPTPSVFVVSHHLDGLLHTWVAGLLHPAAGPEVHRVWPSRSSAPLESGAWSPGRFPAMQDPSERSPRWQPSPRHRGCFPLVVASVGCPSFASGSVARTWAPELAPTLVDFRALLHQRVRCVPDCFQSTNARCSLGLRTPPPRSPSPLRVGSARSHRSYVNVKERSEVSSRLTPGC